MPLDVGAYVGGGMSLSHRSIRFARQAAPYFLPLGNGRTLRSSMFDGEPVVALFACAGAVELRAKSGITGGVAAIANAVYRATAKRVRNLPITLDKVLVTS
jgi:hypothetical protein